MGRAMLGQQDSVLVQAMAIRVVLVDDHTLIREGLRHILQSHKVEVVGEAGTGAEAVAVIKNTQPDVAIVDIALPDTTGIEVAREAKRLCPRTRILILSIHTEAEFVRRALEAGASGYLLKDAIEEDLVRGVHEVAAGESFFSPKVASLLAAGYRDPAAQHPDPLTPRERQILHGIARGKTTKELASELHLAPSTVETHRRRIMRKLDMHNAASLTLYAIRSGVLPLSSPPRR